MGSVDLWMPHVQGTSICSLPWGAPFSLRLRHVEVTWGFSPSSVVDVCVRFGSALGTEVVAVSFMGVNLPPWPLPSL